MKVGKFVLLFFSLNLLVGCSQIYDRYKLDDDYCNENPNLSDCVDYFALKEIDDSPLDIVDETPVDPIDEVDETPNEVVSDNPYIEYWDNYPHWKFVIHGVSSNYDDFTIWFLLDDGRYGDYTMRITEKDSEEIVYITGGFIRDRDLYVISQDVVAENHDELIWTFRDDENDTIFLENVWYSYETGIVTSETVFVDIPSVILEEEID